MGKKRRPRKPYKREVADAEKWCFRAESRRCGRNTGFVEKTIGRASRGSACRQRPAGIGPGKRPSRRLVLGGRHPRPRVARPGVRRFARLVCTPYPGGFKNDRPRRPGGGGGGTIVSLWTPRPRASGG